MKSINKVLEEAYAPLKDALKKGDEESFKLFEKVDDYPMPGQGTHFRGYPKITRGVYLAANFASYYIFYSIFLLLPPTNTLNHAYKAYL